MLIAAFLSRECMHLHFVHDKTVARFLYEEVRLSTISTSQHEETLLVLNSSTKTTGRNLAILSISPLLGALACPLDVGPKDPSPHATTTFVWSFTPSSTCTCVYALRACMYQFVNCSLFLFVRIECPTSSVFLFHKLFFEKYHRFNPCTYVVCVHTHAMHLHEMHFVL